ncbi:MAG: hypothetical protein ACYC5O_00565 [Anaerolineae bacterium]
MSATISPEPLVANEVVSMREVETQTKFIVGLDLGQSQDYSAMVFLDRSQNVTTVQVNTGRYPGVLEAKDLRPQQIVEDATYRLRYLERLPLGTPYPAMVDRVKHVVEQPEIGGRYALVVDQSGVGRPVFDMFIKAGLDAYGITITGGNTHSAVSRTEVRVAKQLLVSAVQVVTQTPGRMGYAEGVAGLDVLRQELGAFHVETTKAAHEIYEAREGAHDDTVLALAIAVWFGETFGKPRWKARSYQAQLH